MIFFYGIASIGSVYGNGLVLWIVRTTKSLQNVNNLLVANLAITDIILAALVTPFQAYAAMEQRWVWHYRLWSFKSRDTKLERFLPKNQHTQRKLLNFENWTNGEPQ